MTEPENPDPSRSPSPGDDATIPYLRQPIDGEATTPPSTPPGSSWVPPTPAELDARMPAFEVRQLLGHGGMGAVYRAIQKSLNRSVAIKVLPPEIADDPAFSERFKREAHALAELNHPNIVHIHDFGKTEAGHFYFVMEFVDGCDFHELIRAGELTPEKILQAVSQICDALAYAHGKGYVHRDIKPANIFLNEEGQVKVGDFGLAKLVDPEAEAAEKDATPTLTMTGTTVGTPQYIAPEAVSGDGPVDQRADIYSLGVMLYEMLTGQVPCGAFEPPSKKVEVNVRLDEIVLKAMADDPERRYQSAVEVRTDVEAIQAGEGETGSSSKAKKGLIVAVGVVAAVTGFFAFRDGEPGSDGVVENAKNKGIGVSLEPKPEWEETKSDPATFGLPAFHGELRPIPGTAGWRSEEPGRVEVLGFNAPEKDGVRTASPEDIRAIAPPEPLTDVVSLSSDWDGVRTNLVIAVREDGSVTAWGPNDEAVSRVPKDLENVASVVHNSTGNGIALHRDGTVTAWHQGHQPVAELMAANLSEVISVALSGNSVYAVTSDGRMQVFGSVVGNAPEIADARAVLVDWGDVLVLHRDGRLSGFHDAGGSGAPGHARLLEFPKDVSAVRASAGGPGLLLDKGSLLTWRNREPFPKFEGVLDQVHSLANLNPSNVYARLKGNPPRWVEVHMDRIRNLPEEFAGITHLVRGGNHLAIGIRPTPSASEADQKRERDGLQ